MKKMIVVLAALLIVTAFVSAREVNLDKALQMYNIAIKEGNVGLQSSAMFQIAQVKAQYPEANFSEIEKTLKKVSRSDENVVVKVRADLVLKYLQKSDLDVDMKNTKENEVLFFDRLYDAVMSDEMTTWAWR